MTSSGTIADPPLANSSRLGASAYERRLLAADLQAILFQIQDIGNDIPQLLFFKHDVRHGGMRGRHPCI